MSWSPLCCQCKWCIATSWSVTSVMLLYSSLPVGFAELHRVSLLVVMACPHSEETVHWRYYKVLTEAYWGTALSTYRVSVTQKTRRHPCLPWNLKLAQGPRLCHWLIQRRWPPSICTYTAENQLSCVLNLLQLSILHLEMPNQPQATIVQHHNIPKPSALSPDASDEQSTCHTILNNCAIRPSFLTH